MLEIDNAETEVKNHDHPDHDKIVTIIVNSREKDWSEKTISFRQVVVLAYGSFEEDPNISYTVAYTRGHDPKPKGILVDGESVKVKKGINFHVTRTDKS